MEIKSQFNRSRNWCFTDWNLENLEQIYEMNKDKIRYICYGYEIGKKSEKPHYQGWMQLTKPMSKSAILKKIFTNLKISIRNCKGTELQNEVYCKKDGDWKSHGEYIKIQGSNIGFLVADIENGKTLNDIIETYPMLYYRFRNGIKDHVDVIKRRKNNEQLLKKFENFELNTAQTNIMEHVNIQTNRQITWVVDDKGNSGKTTLAKYLTTTHKSCIILKNGTSDNLANLYTGQELVLFDLSRSLEKDLNYGTLEDFKDGVVVSGKYGGKSEIYDNPKIVVFANFLPNRNAWSEDRYDIVII